MINITFLKNYSMFLMERPYILEKKSVLFMKNVRTFCVKSIYFLIGSIIFL